MYDSIIIGTGPAGLSAALNLKTYKKDFIWFGSKNLSDKVQKAEKITNYPGFPLISGQELFKRFDAHRRAAEIEITEKTVTNIMPAGDGFMVLADNEVYEARTLILCMGVMSAKQLDREDALLGKRLGYCATCDGMFYKDKRIAVICNDKKYEHEVKYLADIAAEVLYFPTFNESEIELSNVKISWYMPVALTGDSFEEGITPRCGRTESGRTESVDGVFCLRNAIAPSKLMPQLEIENGHIVVDRAQQTNVAGCFAAGDCTGRPYQYTKAVGEGNAAAHSCIQYLSKSEK